MHIPVVGRPGTAEHIGQVGLWLRRGWLWLHKLLHVALEKLFIMGQAGRALVQVLKTPLKVIVCQVAGDGLPDELDIAGHGLGWFGLCHYY